MPSIVTEQDIADLLPLLEEQVWTEDLDETEGIDDPDDDEEGTVQLLLDEDQDVVDAIEMLVEAHPEWTRDQIKAQILQDLATPAQTNGVP